MTTYYDSASDSTWSTWVSSTISATTCTTGDTWCYWTTTPTLTTSCTYSTGAAWGYWNTEPAFHVETEEEKSIRLEAERVAKEEQDKREADRKKREEEKEARAKQLLEELLSEEQSKQLEEKGSFELVSVKSGQRYRINKGRSRNVDKLDKIGRKIATLCFHPADCVHNFDTMAIQKLMLENDEEQVLMIANVG